MDKHYVVTWVIDIEAPSPLEAAKMALEIQRDSKSIATVFDVKLYGSSQKKSIRVDLGVDTPDLFEQH